MQYKYFIMIFFDLKVNLSMLAQKIQLKQNKNYRSMSTDINCERLQVLNKKTRQKINLSIVDLKDEDEKAKGTRVIFDIPNRN